MKLMRHTQTGHIYEAPDSAAPLLVQSGWQALDDEEAEAFERQRKEEVLAADAEMASAAEASIQSAEANPAEANQVDETEKEDG